MSDHERGADPRLTPPLPPDADEIVEGDDPAAGADRTSTLPLGEVDELAAAHPREVAEGDEPAGSDPREVAEGDEPVAPAQAEAGGVDDVDWPAPGPLEAPHHSLDTSEVAEGDEPVAPARAAAGDVGDDDWPAVGSPDAPHHSLDTSEVAEGDEPAAAHPREIAEGDEPAAGTHPAEVAEGDEPTAGVHRTSPLPGREVAESDEPVAPARAAAGDVGDDDWPAAGSLGASHHSLDTSEVAEGDKPAAGADRTSLLALGEVDEVDEPGAGADPREVAEGDEPAVSAGAHRTSPLPGGEVAEGDEPVASARAEAGDVDDDDWPAAEAPYEEDGVELEYGEGLGVSSELGELLEEGEERDAEEAVEGRFDAAPLPGVLVLAVVGVLAGFVMVGLVWASERGCDRVRDSPNCGAAGFPLLVLAVVVTVVLAALALSRLGMPNPKLVAFLGVGFMLLIVLAFLSNDLFSTWTLLVVPVLTAITFLLANLIAGRLERADA